ncbi:MAG: family 78 glycoside hydrolase catalytic domain [Candidatus Ornithomonoglobus sp.]
MKLKKRIVSAALAAITAVGSIATASASNIYDRTTDTYTWSSTGETKITGADDLVEDGQLQIGISNSGNDGRYGTDGRLVWWNGVNANSTANNRKLIFTPAGSGRVTMKVGKIVSDSKYTADIVVNDGSSNIKEQNITAYKSDFTSTADVTFDVTQGKSYTIYPEKKSDYSTGAYITSFVFTISNDDTDRDDNADKEVDTSMEIYSMRTDDMENPIGIDNSTPSFSWKLRSTERGETQKSCKITVAKNADMSGEIWNSGTVTSGNSINIAYNGNALEAMTRYYWCVEVINDSDKKVTSDTAYFETGLMGTDASVWKDAENNEAKWIGNPNASTNTDYLSVYAISADFTVECGSKAGIVINARDKDNYMLVEIDMDNRLVKAYEYNDNAWTDGKPTVTARGNADGYAITTDAVAEGKEYEQNSIKIQANSNRSASIYINDIAVADAVSGFIPANPSNQPRRQYLMNIGLKQENSRAVYDNITVESGDVYQSDDFSNNNGALSALGTVTDGQLVVENEFNLVNPCPSVNVRKAFTADESKTVQSARLYASAQGFYDAYINGQKVNDDFYNPGFTDYRKRIQYQTYDVTDKIQQGQNVIGATVAKGYYTGWVGYTTKPMVYSSKNAFIGKLVINYDDGTRDVIVTDNSWQFTDKGAVVCADYQQGESYDARLEFDWNDTEDTRWSDCGIQDWVTSVRATNGGTLSGEKFELSAQSSPTAKVERALMPVSLKEYPSGHFVYDFGQNMVGTVRLRVKGEEGQSIKLRYGEMCRKNGTLYVANLRTAANTDTYTLKGDTEGETFTPSFTSHGFRYVEITGNGYDLTEDGIENLVVSIEGLVITNTTEETGSFECSNDDINQLYSNIMWGQRGNSLLVYTD